MIYNYPRDPPGPRLLCSVSMSILRGLILFVAFVNTNNIEIWGMGSTGVWTIRPPTVVSSQSQVGKRSTIKNDYLGGGFFSILKTSSSLGIMIPDMVESMCNHRPGIYILCIK